MEIREWLECKSCLQPEEIAALRADSRISVRRLAASFQTHQAHRQAALVYSQRLYRFRKVLHNRGYEHIAGIDEVGRGPLAGPVVAAAVIFAPGIAPLGLDDSKRLSASQRDYLYGEIQKQALAVGIGMAEPQEIDTLNIHRAALLAMRRAVMVLSPMPDFCLVDGRFTIPQLPFDQRAITAGDRRCDAVAAASIIAKVTRDRLMIEFDSQYPPYGFADHKGYPTTKHLQALREHGPCPLHRYSYVPVKLAGQQSIALTRGERNEDRTG
ncbi:MAG: ribonuclease HII [Firmicutes bacterium]|nr:ribonuclease HII [Bacillota bacterium]